MKLLLDTNAYSALMAGNQAAIGRIRHSEHVYLPLIVIGELLYGFALGSRNDENRSTLEAFLGEAHVSLVGIDYEVCEVYSRLASHLRRAGRPIPSNALWIGAIAIRNNLTLLTSDRHFSLIEGLARCDWGS